MMSPAATLRLASLGVAVLVHTSVAGLALWVSTEPHAAIVPPEAITVSIAPPEDAKAEEPEPKPEPKPKPEPEPEPEPLPPPPEPQALPEPLPPPETVLTSASEPVSGDAKTAPLPPEEPLPTPPDPATEAQQASYFGTLLAWLDRHKRYPRQARKNRIEGVVYLHFSMDRSGKVLSYRLEKGSGWPLLDQATVDMIRRADPLPPFPSEMTEQRLELVVPVEFFIRTRSGRR